MEGFGIIFESGKNGFVGPSHPFGYGFLKTFQSDFRPFLVVLPRGRNNRFQANARMLIYRGFHKKIMTVGNLIVSVAQNANCTGPNLVILMIETELENSLIYLVLTPGYPKRLQKIAAIVRITFIQSSNPFFNGGNHLIRWMSSNLTTSPIPSAILVFFQIFQQLVDRGSCHLNGFDKGS